MIINLEKYSEVTLMKKLTLITLIALIAIGVGGCNGFLNEEPQAQIATSNAYQTADDASRAVTSAYYRLQANNWCCDAVDRNGYMYWVIDNVGTDDAIKGGESGGDQVYAQKVAYYTLTPTNRTAEEAWNNLYIDIRYANIVLDKLPDIEMDSDLKKRYMAEAKFLRGYDYFLLVQTFGDVPLVKTTDVEAYDKKRAPASDVLKQAISDFKDAASVLPTKSQYSSEDIGRASKGAAQAYLGKLYMWMGDFTNAEDWLGRVIDSKEYSLATDYGMIFTKAGENGPGSIFEIQYNYNPPKTQQNPMGVVQGSRSMYGWGFNAPTQDFVDEFESGDPRLKQSVYENGDTLRDGRVADVGNSPSGYLNYKEYVGTSEAPGGFFNSANNEIMMRFAKVLLWYAEAANENGHTQKALDALNRVRKRARQGNSNVLPDVTVTDKTKLRKAIWHEERVEYGNEYDRRFDLLRTGRMGDVMRGYAQKYNTPKGANFKDGKNEVLPIPAAEISLSDGKLTQNPGY